MVNKETVGTRFRQTRTNQRKTLKDVEARSGFSSTHISEIERGRTSPTVGALIRIAQALDKDPSYFIEERELEEVSVTTDDERAPSPGSVQAEGKGFAFAGLTRGILGGRIQAAELDLEPQGVVNLENMARCGDFCLICLSGRGMLQMGDREIEFKTEDSLHASSDVGRLTLRGMGEASRFLLVTDPRESIC